MWTKGGKTLLTPAAQRAAVWCWHRSKAQTERKLEQDRRTESSVAFPTLTSEADWVEKGWVR